MSEALRARADLRGFIYAPEPLVQRQQWRLEAAQARLGQWQRRIAEARRELQENEERHLAQSRQAVVDWQARRDPAAYRSTLLYLAQLQTAIEAGHRALHELRQQRDRLRSECWQLQNQLDGFAKDRAREEEAYAAELARRDATEADRDWNARRPWRAPVSGNEAGREGETQPEGEVA